MLPTRNGKERTNHGYRQNLSMETFNIFTNESVNPQRMATRAAIKAFGNSAPIEDTEIEIDEAELDGNGIWTPPERR